MFRSDRKNEKKFQEKIEEQEQKIVRYESRLRDVVQAYKSLQKEKDALESTVKALSTTSNSENSRKPRKADHEKQSPTADPLSSPNSDTSSPLKEEGSINNAANANADVNDDVDDDEVQMLNEKVVTLSKALATVSEEKSKMEAAFQIDKKLAIQEQEKRLRESDEQMEMLEVKYAETEANLKEMKSRLYHQQLELETEQTNNALMLKEMQQLLSTERLEKEELKIRLQERKDTKTSKSNENTKLYEMKIQELSDELAKVSARLKRYEEAATQPSPLLLQLSDEMNGLKRHHNDVIDKERQRANEAEETLKQFSTMEEERIAVLETRLTELSEVVGSYEKLRYQDQQVITKLKEKLSQLDVSNNSTKPEKEIVSPELEIDNQATEMKDEMSKLKSFLKSKLSKADLADFNSHENEPITAAELDSILHNDPAHRACQLEYKQLKEEFENYKTENRIKRKENNEQTPELPELKERDKSECLIKEMELLKECFDKKELEYNERIKCLECDCRRLGDKNTEEISKLEEFYKGKVLMLELQLTKQRERTLQLISDKDMEINKLKGEVEVSSPTDRRQSRPRPNNASSFVAAPVAEQGDVIKRSVETEVAVKQLLSRQDSAGSESTLVYYVQQMSHLQSEIAALRNRNLELETVIRDEEHREDQILDQMKILKDEIRKLERNRSRENANLEYIKNVVLQYMLSDSISVKEQLAKAIGVVLQFSPVEINDIHKKQTGWWSSQQK